ncbi:hypothetical protein [Pandoravirus japonicus]|uniref:Uncharacterized protein n=1 Tax=Pandoravirus japonicus TaxID=2823154 RepID=A0A811BNW4_9VIRU|nr:hypothetical protein [Pandoravirus japonicus]
MGTWGYGEITGRTSAFSREDQSSSGRRWANPKAIETTRRTGSTLPASSSPLWLRVGVVAWRASRALCKREGASATSAIWRQRAASLTSAKKVVSALGGLFDMQESVGVNWSMLPSLRRPPSQRDPKKTGKKTAREGARLYF